MSVCRAWTVRSRRRSTSVSLGGRHPREQGHRSRPKGSRDSSPGKAGRIQAIREPPARGLETAREVQARGLEAARESLARETEATGEARARGTEAAGEVRTREVPAFSSR